MTRLRSIAGGKNSQKASTPFPSQGPAAEKAAWYVDHGYVPIPIASRTKSPGTGWNLRTLESARPSLEKDFADPAANVGVLLGAPSGNLTDVDLDCAEVVKVGGRFLPRTPMSFGRQSAPRSHAIYRCPKVKTERFFDPRKPADQEHGTLVEVRSDGCQTVFPGSVHPSGEVVRFEIEPGTPAEVKALDLRRAVAKLAAAALLGRYWPKAGRHEAQLALAGGLLEAGWADLDADSFLCAVCFLAGDEDADKRHRTVVSTRERLDAGEHVTSWSRLSSAVGDDVVVAVRKWLAVRDGVVVRISADIRQMTNEAERALAREGGKDCAQQIYARGPHLVRVEGDTPIFAELPKAAVLEAVSANAVWIAVDAKGEKPVRPPKDVIDALIARRRYPRLPRAKLITQRPVMLPDRTLLLTRGFHADGGILYLPKEEFPEFADIQRDEADEKAKAAAAVLLDAIEEFRFESEADRAAAMAVPLTIVGRAAFTGPCPMFLIDAADGGEGKGLLANTLAIMATGRPPPTEHFVSDENEQRKRLTTHAKRGSQVMNFDNVDCEISGAPLEAVLTTTTYGDRLLGANDYLEADWRTVVLGTANNATIGDTMYRRILAPRLACGVESPERRKFKRSEAELLKLAAEPRMVMALLTMLRAYVVAGMPRQADVGAWGSYGGWAELVVGTLLFAGLPNPIEIVDRFAKRADPRRMYEHQFVEAFAWLVAEHGQPVTASGFLGLLESPGDLISKHGGTAREKIDDFRRGALGLLSMRRRQEDVDTLSEVKLGILLGQLAGKVRGGRRIARVDEALTKSRRTPTRWTIEVVGDTWEGMGDAL